MGAGDSGVMPSGPALSCRLPRRLTVHCCDGFAAGVSRHAKHIVATRRRSAAARWSFHWGWGLRLVRRTVHAMAQRWRAVRRRHLPGPWR